MLSTREGLRSLSAIFASFLLNLYVVSVSMIERKEERCELLRRFEGQRIVWARVPPNKKDAGAGASPQQPDVNAKAHPRPLNDGIWGLRIPVN